MTLIPDLVAMTERFARDIIGLPIPDAPTRLEPERKKWASGALAEELTEFMDAETLEDEADALLDLMYFAGGRLIEMGLVPGAAFEEVHLANMAKERGELSKRPHSKGFDAIKPEGWTPPDLSAYCNLRRDDVLTLDFLAQLIGDHPYPAELSAFETEEQQMPNVLVLGYGRHGKDTVSEMLRDNFGFTFTSSSEFCAEKVVMAAIEEAWSKFEAAGGHPAFPKPTIPRYASAQECFDDRANHRQFWYEAIRDFNRPDLTALGQAIFAENDVYCGLRHKSEFHAVKNAGIPDIVVWVDRSDHLPPEPKESCSVEPWMADFIIDNNGTIEELELNVLSLFDRLMGEYNAE
ncbi:Cof hydrolase [Roseobacter phage RDJL Phi 1]|uniref:Cof hydrolase n=1 Tax=Roseobacter phage RDJL Phi 1 TaxID=562742 RepID=F4YXM9_9CAUD|nr:Cof hydrolase [Roseobacter phage RDJL Phi 1]ADK73419.1 Cof hydrolase [Roseobacter phage RDJL Phi 1]